MKSRAIIFTTILSAAACFGLSPRTQAVVPPPDGGYLRFNTAEDQKAPFSLTTGTGNVAVGWDSLYSDAEGSLNTGVGAGALVLNTNDNNTAVGAVALLLNTTGTDNTAVGTDALALNTSAFTNVAVGTFAAENNDSSGNGTAYFNTAVGAFPLQANIDGTENTAVGAGAMESGNEKSTAAEDRAERLRRLKEERRKTMSAIASPNRESSDTQPGSPSPSPTPE